LFSDKINLSLDRHYHSVGKFGKFVGVSNWRKTPNFSGSNSWTATCFCSTSRSRSYCGL